MRDAQPISERLERKSAGRHEDSIPALMPKGMASKAWGAQGSQSEASALKSHVHRRRKTGAKPRRKGVHRAASRVRYSPPALELVAWTSIRVSLQACFRKSFSVVREATTPRKEATSGPSASGGMKSSVWAHPARISPGAHARMRMIQACRARESRFRKYRKRIGIDRVGHCPDPCLGSLMSSKLESSSPVPGVVRLSVREVRVAEPSDGTRGQGGLARCAPFRISPSSSAATADGRALRGAFWPITPWVGVHRATPSMHSVFSLQWSMSAATHRTIGSSQRRASPPGKIRSPPLPTACRGVASGTARTDQGGSGSGLRLPGSVGFRCPSRTHAVYRAAFPSRSRKSMRMQGRRVSPAIMQEKTPRVITWPRLSMPR